MILNHIDGEDDGPDVAIPSDGRTRRPVPEGATPNVGDNEEDGGEEFAFAESDEEMDFGKTEESAGISCIVVITMSAKWKENMVERAQLLHRNKSSNLMEIVYGHELFDDEEDFDEEGNRKGLKFL